jgi:hypothetical protein
VVEESDNTLMLVTGRTLDVLSARGDRPRDLRCTLRAAGIVVPVAATPPARGGAGHSRGGAAVALRGVAGVSAQRR